MPQPKARRPLRATLARLLVAAGLAWPAAAVAGDYVLGPQDKVRVKVVEWRGSVGQFFEWTPLTGEFSLGGDGRLSLPLIGEVQAAGLRTEQLSAEIARRLRERVGLVDLPAASVEIAQFRPFYVLGLVERPGEYPFRPGLTILQAVGIAGGLYRPTEAGLVRMQRDAIAAGGDFGVRQIEIRAARAKEARLTAELDERDAVVFPADLAADPASRELIRGEEMTFRSRREALRAQAEGAQRLMELYRNEITAQNGKLRSHDRQLELIEKERDSVSSLVAKGLAVAPRQYMLERSVAEIESKRLDLDTAILRARQEYTKAERSIVDFRNERRQETVADLQATRARRAEAEQKAETARSLVQEAEVIAPRLLADRIRSQKVDPTYTILRRTPQGPRTLGADELTPLEPGDVVKVDSNEVDPLLAATAGRAIAAREVSPRASAGN